MMRFAGKSALVTGAASGIGLATAVLLAREGCDRLVLVDTNSDALGQLEFECATETLAGDVADPGLWASADIGQIDHAVINAGVAGAGLIADLNFEEWRRILSVNLDGAFLSLQAALRAIRDGGSIVTVASAAGLKPEPGVAAYGASKAGLIQLTRSMALELAAEGIRVNAICPGPVSTDGFLAGRNPGELEQRAGDVPIGRFGTVEEVAGVVAFLVSKDAGYVAGHALVMDGGYIVH